MLLLFAYSKCCKWAEKGSSVHESVLHLSQWAHISNLFLLYWNWLIVTSLHQRSFLVYTHHPANLYTPLLKSLVMDLIIQRSKLKGIKMTEQVIIVYQHTTIIIINWSYYHKDTINCWYLADISIHSKLHNNYTCQTQYQVILVFCTGLTQL